LPRYSIIYKDVDSIAIGISPWPMTFPVQQETVERLGPIVVQLEDRRFWNHTGIDWFSLARAICQNFLALRIVQGAGTLTQQLVRNTFVYPDRSFARKIVEMVLARRIERLLSKEEIIKAYCGLVHLGPGVRGFDAALRIYHRKPISQATDNELRATTGCLRTPMLTSPLVNKTAYAARAIQVNRFLQKSEPDNVGAALNPVYIHRLKQLRLARLVDKELADTYGSKALIPRDIRHIHLALCGKHQGALSSALKQAFDDSNVESAAGLIIDSKTGRVLAEMALQNGERSEHSPSFTGTIQPGSTFKAIVLLEALEQGLSEKTLIESMPFQWRARGFPNGVWRVRNYRHQYRGLCSIEDALIHSDNTVFARLIQMLGTENVIRRLASFDLLGPKDCHPSAGLGAVTDGISLSRLARAFAALSTGNLPPPPNFIRGIEFYDGTLTLPKEMLLGNAYSLRSLSRLDSILSRSGFTAGGRQVRGKSGTAGRNSVYVGYDDNLSYALWVGFRKVRSEWWAKGAQAKTVLEKVLDSLSGRNFTVI
jgi:penicillin-binding protein 1A